MNYLDAGFDPYFQREWITPSVSLTPFDRQVSEEGISADQIVSGQLRSTDGSTTINLESGYISVTVGGIERIRLGNIDSGVTGLQIVSPTGKPIIKITNTENYIRSPDGATAIDFDKNRIVVRENDENGPVRVLLGFDPAGF